MSLSDSFEPDDRVESFFRSLEKIDSCPETQTDNGGNSGEAEARRSGRGSGLDSWAREHAETINEDLVVVEREADSHGGKRLLNLGTPLYNAVVRDIPEAVGILLDRGADPNRSHPVHGDSPVLHCAERGYDACLRALIDGAGDRLDPYRHVTIDRRFLLGQGLPQYEEGGLNPLSIAVRAGRLGVVDILFSCCPPSWVQCWKDEQDVIGRTVAENVFDFIVLAVDGSKKQADLMEISRILTENSNQDTNPDRVLLVPTRDEAMARVKERLSVVRKRCLESDLRLKEKERNVGLKAILDHYKPLHPEVYSERNIREACLPFECAIKEPIPGVFTFPLLDPHFCELIWREIHHYEALAASEPKLCLPLRVRHDGNIGDLQDCGFRPLLEILEHVCRPILLQCLGPAPSVNPGDFSGAKKEFGVYHAFLTRNFVGRESNATFNMHRDKSDLTINVCLFASDGFEGSTVGFYRPETPESTTGEQEIKDNTPTDKDRIYTHVHEVGYAVVHGGNSWHRTDPIVKGTRGSLILWANRLSEH